MRKSSSTTEYVEVFGKIVHETSKALLLQDIGGQDNWFPLSCIKAIHRNPTSPYESSVEVELWLAEKKGVA